MDFFYDLEGEGERYSFDSDGFDEESICSWISEPESMCNVWRGWSWRSSKQSSITANSSPGPANGAIDSLIELAAKTVAAHIPFGVVENYPQPIPEDLQLKIAYWSFPNSEEDIRLYSCLANGSADEFLKGEQLYKGQCVKDALQIGFHLSGTVLSSRPLQTSQTIAKDGYSTSVVFDRQRITSNNCTCEQTTWCQHIVALCLQRVHQPKQVKVRAPISETLSRLDREQLQKFAQYLIHELHDQQILPTAQRLLDELLSSQPTAINTVDGAPDPTAGPEGDQHSAWYMDQRILHENIKKTLVKFCVPSPIVYSDLNCLSTSAPPAAAEWQSLLRPLRGREPEGIWNLLSIVRELFRRKDSNAVPLLEILTDEMLQCEQLLVWWYSTKLPSLHSNVTRNTSANTSSAQNAASSLCDEIVTLWRLAALNPCLSPSQREDLKSQLETWHIMTLDKVRTAKCSVASKKEDVEMFPGFKSAFEATQIDWRDYRIFGITYGEKPLAAVMLPGQTCLTHDGYASSTCKSKISPVTTYQVDDSKYSYANSDGFHPPGDRQPRANAAPQSRSRNDESSSSEGFCEPSETKGQQEERDSDWSDDGPQPIKDGYIAADDDSDLDNSISNAIHAEAVGIQISVDGASTTQEVAVVSQPVLDGLDVYMHNMSVGVLAEDDVSSKEPNYFAGIKKWEDEKEISFARAEALHAHGFVKEACELACRLALNVLEAHDDKELDGSKSKKKLAQSAANNASCTMTTGHPLNKAAFLCTVLLEDRSYHHLAFKIGMYGLEMHREPAQSKALEVRLANQESELVALLKRIPLGPAELNVIRDRAEQLRDGKLRSRGDAHLPLMLATFIFDSLCLPAQMIGSSSVPGSRPPSRCVNVQATRLATDEMLGFEAAVAALGLKANVSEAQYPLICEGTRRQKGDLAVAMMVLYKDDQYKLDKILEKLLDKEVHQLFKAPPISSYLSSSNRFSASRHSLAGGASGEGLDGASAPLPNLTADGPKADDLVRPRLNHARTSFEDPGLEDVEARDVETRLRCGIYGKANKRPSVGMAAVDSSAPETTSSDNSPPVVRRTYARQGLAAAAGGAGSDSESSGRSSDSVGSASSLPKMQAPKSCDSPAGMKYLSQYTLESRCMVSKPFSCRSKGKPRATPTEPNQPSEALAHFMFELAKTLLQKAGGSSSTSLFTQRDNNTHSGPHRMLHICAFQVGLYALGINNCVSKNWLSRTYSSHVSWITGQAMEIGTVAINILIDTWEGHLTPTEVASLTDRASRGRDPNMVRAAADLALSCLAHAQALNPQETRRALLQCKEQSNAMLEKACLAVESAAKDGSVFPEVLFDVARRWFELHEESRQNSTDPMSGENGDAAQPTAPPQHSASPINPLLNRHSNSPQQFITSTNSAEMMVNQAGALYGRPGYPPPSTGYPPASTGYPPAPNINPMPQAFPYYSTYVPCYATSQFSNQSPGRPIAMQATGYIATIPGLAYGQPFTAVTPQIAAAAMQNGGFYQIGPSNTNVYSSGGQIASPMVTVATNLPNQLAIGLNNVSHHHIQQPQQFAHLVSNPEQLNYVMSAFRVGMLALETYGRRISDERPMAKYNRNPSCREDIKWLLGISMKLGPNYLQQFCQNAVNSLFSPFILHDIATEVAFYQTRNNAAQMQTAFRSPILSSLMQRCLQMYIQCAHHRIHHIQPADYEEFISIITAACKAFSLVPSGMVQFHEMLQNLRRNKSCKKELWQRIISVLSTANVP